MRYRTTLLEGPEIPGLVKHGSRYMLPGLVEDQAYIRIEARNGGAEWQISRIYVEPAQRQQGIAGQLLRFVIIQADIERVLLSLVVQPEDATMRAGDLKRFYRSYGFVEKADAKGCMVRRPRTLV